MAVVSLTPGTPATVPSPGVPIPPAGIEGATNWIQQGIQFVNSLTQLMNAFNSNPLFQRIIPQQGNEVLNSDISAKIHKQQMAPALPAVAPTPAQGSLSDQDLMNFFNTPDGMKKISSILEQVKAVTGDCKLSELQNFVNTFSPNKTQSKNSKGEKKK